MWTSQGFSEHKAEMKMEKAYAAAEDAKLCTVFKEILNFISEIWRHTFKMTLSFPLQVIGSKEIAADKSKLLCQSRFIAHVLISKKNRK